MTSYDKADIPPHLLTGRNVVNPAIFVFAHQDDETLTFGAEIELHKAAGRYIIGVCATDGRSSSARGAIGISIPDFVTSRDLELYSAASALGIDELYTAGGIDAGLSQSQSDALVSYWYRRYPSASFKVPTDYDDNVDHMVLGRSFRSLKVAYPASDIRFYIKPEQRSTIARNGTTLAPTGDSVRAAAEEYRRLDPAAGRYAVGNTSVGGDFAPIYAGVQPISVWHY